LVEERGPLLLARLLCWLHQVDGLLKLGRQGAELRAHGVALHHLAPEAQAACLSSRITSHHIISYQGVRGETGENSWHGLGYRGGGRTRERQQQELAHASAVVKEVRWAQHLNLIAYAVQSAAIDAPLNNHNHYTYAVPRAEVDTNNGTAYPLARTKR